MKTSNPVLDNIIESQTQFINNWMDSAKKMQSVLTSGNVASEGQQLYKEYFEKQMEILNNMQKSTAGMFGENGSTPQDFFRNWFNQQAGYAKQMADFTQSIQNSFSSFGKPAQDYMSGFGQSNNAFSGIYNSWMNTLNESYDHLSRNMNGGFNKNVFSNFMQGSQMYARMQEFFQPMASAMQNGRFNMDAFKDFFTPDSYKNLTKQMFGNFYNESSVKEVYDNAIKQIQEFFSTQNNLSKEYFQQMKSFSEKMPEMFAGNSAGNLKEFYSQIQNVFGKTFEPLMKLVSPGKEKESVEALISMMDRVAEYSVKQAELQAFLQTTAKKGVEEIASRYADKFSDPKSLNKLPSTQEMYNEWVKVNEELFTELFKSEEFSKVKGETINLGMELKKQFEQQFENTFRNYPVVFKSEIEDLQKTVHSLKKQVRELQSQLAMTEVDGGEETKTAKKAKK